MNFKLRSQRCELRIDIRNIIFNLPFENASLYSPIILIYDKIKCIYFITRTVYCWIIFNFPMEKCDPVSANNF